MRLKSGIGVAAAAAVFTTLGVVPAFADEPAPSGRTAAPAVQQSFEGACTGVSFPLALDEAGETFTVTDPVDSGDEGTLRWAVSMANENPGLDEIVIAPGLVVKSAGDLEITDALLLRGADASSEIVNITDDNASLFTGVFEHTEFPVQISSLILSGGSESATGLDFASGACALALDGVTVRDFAFFGVLAGGTWPFETLEVDNSVFSGNTEEPGGGRWGALHVIGELVTGKIRVSNTDFVDNKIPGMQVQSGIVSRPGERGELLIENSRFVNNQSEGILAGGLQLSYAEFSDYDEPSVGEPAPPETPIITIRDTLFRENVGGPAGAVSLPAAYVSEARGANTTVLSVERTTFDRNTTNDVKPRSGSTATDIKLGDVYIEDASGSTALSVSDSTFAGVPGAAEPSLWFDTVAGKTLLQHVTMLGGGIEYDYPNEGSTIDLRNSVFDTAEKQPIGPSGGGLAPDEFPILAEQQVAYTVAPTAADAGPGRILGAPEDFALDALDDSLGQTPVMVPGADSVLIDAAGEGGSATDQRGLARPQGAAADIGAVEYAAPVDPELLPSSFVIGDDQSVAAGTALGFEVSRTNAAENPWTGEASVRVRTADGSATAGADYTAFDEVLTWAADDIAAKAVTVPTSAGHVDEGDVTLTVTLSEPGENSVLGERTTATGTITRDEDSGTVVPPTVTPPTVTPPTVTPPTVTPPITGPTDPATPTPERGGLANTGQDALPIGLLLAGVLTAAAGVVLIALKRRGRRA